VQEIRIEDIGLSRRIPSGHRHKLQYRAMDELIASWSLGRALAMDCKAERRESGTQRLEGRTREIPVRSPLQTRK